MIWQTRSAEGRKLDSRTDGLRAPVVIVVARIVILAVQSGKQNVCQRDCVPGEHIISQVIPHLFWSAVAGSPGG